MSGDWGPSEREKAYTRLCEALSSAGPERETLLLARLVLLLAEALEDASAFGAALSEAQGMLSSDHPAATAWGSM